MIAGAGPAGLYGTPVTKFLLCQAAFTYLLFAFPLQHFHYLFHYDQDVVAKQQWKKMLLSKMVFLELPDLLFSSLLIYNFRIFERRFGSRKFASHILSTAVMANLLELMVFWLLNSLDIHLGPMPTGMYSLIFPLYVSFYCCIPRVALMHVMGVPVTGKTLNYIVGLQMASTDVESLMVTACALMAGVLWRVNFLQAKTVIQVPMWLARLCDGVMGHFLRGSEVPATSLPMGATLELQQRERLDRLEQQMMMAALQTSSGRRVDTGGGGGGDTGNSANDTGIFGAAEHQQNRGSGTSEDQGSNGEEASSSEGASSSSSGSSGGRGGGVSVSPEQVSRLVEMGFSDTQVRLALRATNNNPTRATHYLLHGM